MTRRDGASVLMLMPAAVLVVLLLGAIALDLSLVFLRQRQASSVATDVANDLATAAVDESSVRADGTYRLDDDRARSLGHALVEESDVGPIVDAVSVTVIGDDIVEVQIVLRVDHVFGRAVPGSAGATSVQATASARASSN